MLIEVGMNLYIGILKIFNERLKEIGHTLEIPKAKDLVQ